MGANNFCYKNRCIVVTCEDYKYNSPKMGDWIDSNRNYPSREILIGEEFLTVKPVITSAYYDGACIDYLVLDKYDIYNELLEKVYDKIDCNTGDTIRYNLAEDREKSIITKYYAWLLKREEEKLNILLDKLKREYGYIELNCVARASNGEAFYKVKRS